MNKELGTLTRQEQNIRERKAFVLRDLGTLTEALNLLRAKGVVSSWNGNGNGKSHAFEISTASLNENTRIADAIAVILREKGDMNQRDIIEQLRKHRVRISLMNPYQVLGNTVRRDKKKRFLILANRRVTLRRENR